ncbi:MAG TPA: hypothetical protein PKI32_10205 [Opitutales bacterium]|nr:hypothetical protein [Opitutales bacterium]
MVKALKNLRKCPVPLLAAAMVILPSFRAAAQDVAADVPPAPTVESLAAKIDENSTAIQLSVQNNAASLTTLRRDIEGKIEQGNTAVYKAVTDVHNTQRITAIATTATSLVAAVLSLVILLRLSHVMGAIGQIPAPQGAPTASSGSAPAVAAALARIEDRLNAIPRAAPTKAPDPAPVPREVMDKLATIEAALQGLSTRREAAAQSDTTADAFWPKAVRGSENYPLWRKGLGEAVSAGRPEALRLASALLTFNALPARRDADAEKYADMVSRLSASLYAYLYSIEGVPEADRLDPVSALLRAVKDDAQVHYPNLEIRAFFPNERLNTDLMEKTDSGTRLSITRPLSWLVVDKTGGREHIFSRAQVITG